MAWFDLFQDICIGKGHFWPEYDLESTLNMLSTFDYLK